MRVMAALCHLIFVPHQHFHCGAGHEVAPDGSPLKRGLALQAHLRTAAGTAGGVLRLWLGPPRRPTLLCTAARTSSTESQGEPVRSPARQRRWRWQHPCMGVLHVAASWQRVGRPHPSPASATNHSNRAGRLTCAAHDASDVHHALAELEAGAEEVPAPARTDEHVVGAALARVFGLGCRQAGQEHGAGLQGRACGGGERWKDGGRRSLCETAAAIQHLPPPRPPLRAPPAPETHCGGVDGGGAEGRGWPRACTGGRSCATRRYTAGSAGE